MRGILQHARLDAGERLGSIPGSHRTAAPRRSDLPRSSARKCGAKRDPWPNDSVMPRQARGPDVDPVGGVKPGKAPGLTVGLHLPRR